MSARLLNIVNEDRDKPQAEIPFDLDTALAETVELGASDLHIKPGCRPRVRVEGELDELNGYTSIGRDQLHAIAKAVLLSDMKRQILEQEGSADLSYDAPCGRFRVSAFRQRGGTSYIFRTIPEAPDFDELALPEVVLTWAGAPQGLVIITGPTGSGKSTTSAALIRRINEGRSCHIVTVEDPIEFIHHDAKALVSQREIGADAPSFSRALKAALRQDPDVILIGEIRDQETMETALAAAETGHLVLSTLHTLNASETISRIISLFPPHMQQQARFMLSGTLRGVIAQRLVPSVDGTQRIPVVEALVSTGRVRDLILEPSRAEDLNRIIHEGEYYGMQTFDQSLIARVNQGLISMDEALRVANNPSDMKLQAQSSVPSVAGV